MLYVVKPGYCLHLPYQRFKYSGETVDLSGDLEKKILESQRWKLEPVGSEEELGMAKPAVSPLPNNPHPVSQQQVESPNEGISIIIPAWKAADFLKECLDSLAGQSYFSKGANYEILLGIDACKTTRRRALKIARNYEHLRVFWFDENYGPYIIKNSLAAIAKYDRLLFFDADDMAEKDMAESLLAYDNGHNGAAVYMLGRDMATREVKRTCGVFLIGRKNFLRIGGFMPWKCAADTEFFNRLPVAQITRLICEKILMRRRTHENQVTVKGDTGFKSELRACYMAQIKQIARLGIADIGLVTAKCEQII
jgi:hypothetical protein